MSNNNDMDALDSLLIDTIDASNPLGSDELTKLEIAAVKSAATSEESAKQANATWAEVIEKATTNMQDSARMAQLATQKNIELAKQQNTGIKELSEATHGWRNVARQTYEEIISARKTIFITSIVGVVMMSLGSAITATLVWSNTSSNSRNDLSLKESFEEYQQHIDKTLAMKLDEMNSLIEQIPSQPMPVSRKNEINDEQDETPEQTETVSVTTSPSLAINNELLQTHEEKLNQIQQQLSSVLSAIEQTNQHIASQQSQIATVSPAAIPVSASPAPSINLDAITAKIAATTAAVTNLQDKLDEKLNTQLAKLPDIVTNVEKNTLSNKNLTEQLNKIQTELAEIKQLQISLKEKEKSMTADKTVTEQMVKIQKELFEVKQLQISLREGKGSGSPAQDKALSEQVVRLQKELREVKQQQVGIKEQVQDVKQQIPSNQPTPYQYKLEVERYPR